MPARLTESVDRPAAARTALADRCTPDNPRAAAAAELETLLREVV